MINYTAFIGLGFLLLCVYAQVRPPNFSPDSIPETSFTCEDKITGGYYADVEADCQLFHVCVQVSEFEFQDFRFLCPNDTVFDQQNLVCTNWFEVDCAQSVSLFSNDFGFKDLSGTTEKAEKFDYNYNEGISYEYYEYDSSDEETGGLKGSNRFLVNSSPAYHKGSLGAGREHGQGFLGGDAAGGILPHSSTAIPVGVTTTKRPPRVKSNLRKKRPGSSKAPRYRNPFNNPPKKAADGRRPRVKSDIRQRHHGSSSSGNSHSSVSRKNKLGRKVQISRSELKFADPLDNQLFSGPEVRPDGRPPRVKSNLNAVESNSFNSFSTPTTRNPFNFIPKDTSIAETSSFKPFLEEVDDENDFSLNAIEFSSDLFPSSTSQPFIPQNHHRPQEQEEQHRSIHRVNNANNNNKPRPRVRNNGEGTSFHGSTTRRPHLSSTPKTALRSSTVLPFVSTPGFKVPFLTRDQGTSISSTAAPTEFKIPFLSTSVEDSSPNDDFRVPFVSKTNLAPPSDSESFRPPFKSNRKPSSTTRQEGSSFRGSFGSTGRRSFRNSFKSISTPSPRVSIPSSPQSTRGFSSTPFPRGSSTSSSVFKSDFSTPSRSPSSLRPSFNGGISTSGPSRLSSNNNNRSKRPSASSTISALSQSFSSTTYSPSSTTKRSIISFTTASPSISSTVAGFFNVPFTTRSPGSSPRVKSNIQNRKDLTEVAIEKNLAANNNNIQSSSDLPRFIDEIDEFETPISSPRPPISHKSSPRPQKTRKRVTKRRKVLRKKGFQGKNFASQQFAQGNQRVSNNNNNNQLVNHDRHSERPKPLSNNNRQLKNHNIQTSDRNPVNSNNHNKNQFLNQNRQTTDRKFVNTNNQFKNQNKQLVEKEHTPNNQFIHQDNHQQVLKSKEIHNRQPAVRKHENNVRQQAPKPKQNRPPAGRNPVNNNQFRHQEGHTQTSKLQQGVFIPKEEARSHSEPSLSRPTLQNARKETADKSAHKQKLLISDEDESFNDITAPGSSHVDRDCSDPFKCPPKKRAGGHRPRVKSNIRAKSRNFHFQHKLGRKITDSNTVRSFKKPNRSSLQVSNNSPPRSNIRPARPKPTQRTHQQTRDNPQQKQANSLPKQKPSNVRPVQKPANFLPPQKPEPSGPPKSQLPNRPLNKNQFLNFLSSIGNASPIITINSKTGKLSSFPGSGFSNGLPSGGRGGENIKGVSSASIQNFPSSTPSSSFISSSPRSVTFTTPSSSFISSSRRPGTFTSPSSSFISSSSRPGIFTSPSPSFISSSPRPFSSSSNDFDSSSPRPNQRFGPTRNPEILIASSTIRSFSTTSSNGFFQGSSTTETPSFSSPRSINNRFRSKGRRNRPAPFTKTFYSNSPSVSTTPFRSEISTTNSPPLLSTSPTTTTTTKNPIFLPPTPANKILTINDIIGIVATESPRRQPRVKSNLLLAQRNSERAGRRLDNGRRRSGDRQLSKGVRVNSNGEDERTKLFFAGSNTPSSNRVSSTTKRSISVSAAAKESLEQKDISTTKGPLVVKAKDVSLVSTQATTTKSASPFTTTTTTPTTTTLTTTSTLSTTSHEEDLMELHKNMTNIEAKIQFNNKNDKEPVVRPDGQKPRVKSNLRLNSGKGFRGSLSRRRPNRFSFNRSAIKPTKSPLSSTENTPTTPFFPTIPTTEAEVTTIETLTSEDASSKKTTLKPTLSTSTTTTTTTTSSPSGPSSFKSRFNKYKKKQPSKTSSSFLKNFLKRQRARKGLLKTQTSSPSTTDQPTTLKTTPVSQLV